MTSSWTTTYSRPLAIRWWLTALFLVGLTAFAARWCYISQAIIDTPIQGDAVQYHAYAWNMVNHGIFSKSKPGSAQVIADNFRDPGYPLFIAAWMEVTGDFPAWYPYVLLAQALLGAATVMLLMSSARRWIRDSWLIGAGLLMATWPHCVTITSYVLSETLFGFLCALAIYLFSRVPTQRGSMFAGASGLTFGAAALTNAVATPFAPLLAICLACTKFEKKKALIVLALSATILPAAWAVRNAHISQAESSTHRAIMNLVQGSWPEYHISYYRKLVHGDGDPESAAILRNIDSEYAAFQTGIPQGLSAMSDRIKKDPLHYLAWYLRKPALLWGWSIRIGEGDIYVYQTPYSPFKENRLLRLFVSLCHAVNPILMALMILGVGLVLIRYSDSTPDAIVIVSLIIYVTFVYSVLQAEPRYSIPFRGLEILAAAFGAQRAADWARAKQKAAPAS